MASEQKATGEGPHGSLARTCRAFGWILLGAVGAFLPTAQLLVVVILNLDLDGLSRAAITEVRKLTGRELFLPKTPHVSLAFRPIVTLDEVAFANASWGSRAEMLRIRRMEIQLKLFPLLRGMVAINRLVLLGTDLLLETNDRGTGNWDVGPPTTFLSRLSLGEVRLEGVTVTYFDGRTRRATHVTSKRLHFVRSRKAAGQLDADGTIDLDGRPVAFSGTIGSLETLFSNDQPFPFRMTVKSTGVVARFDGTIARPLDASGIHLKATATADDGPALATLLGTALPPVVTRMTPLRIEVEMRDTADGYDLDPVRVEAGGSSISGRVNLALKGARPRISATLSSPLLDLARLAPRSAGPSARVASKGGASRQRVVFPREPLPLAALRGADADAKLTVASLMLPGGVQAESLLVHVSLANGRLAMEPFSVRLGNGHISGTASMETAGTPTLHARLEGGGLELGALLTSFGIASGITGGTCDLAIELRARGSSIHELMSTLGGRIRVSDRGGRIQNAMLDFGGDVLTMAVEKLGPFRGGNAPTVLHCLVVNAPIEGGVVNLDRRFGFESSTLDGIGRGKIDLGAETIDLQIRAHAVEGLKVGLGNYADAVRIRGPLNDPALAVDAAGAAGAVARIGAVARGGRFSTIARALLDRFWVRAPCKTALGAGS